MPCRDVLSPLSRISRAVLLALAVAAAPAVHAEDGFPLLSFFAPPPAARPVAVADSELVVEELKPPPVMTQAVDLTVPPSDLWVRIRHGFSMPNLYDDLVVHYQNWYESRPDALRRMVERSRPYLHFIVEEIEARGMPTELALLPMVESSFNPMAYSRSHASGLWQFIPATGKRFNLEQSWWQDQRRDILASTGAALDYLQTIYELNGDWHLALASYNWGEGAVKRAMEKNAARGLSTDYASLNMPQETRHYVPKLQALKNIFSNPVLMAQLRLPPIHNRPYLARIEVSSPMDVKKAARLAEMPLNEFVALNPSHNRPVIKSDTPLVVPADRLGIFQNNLEKNSAETLSEWQAYTLRPGDKLDKLAPRFGIKLADLKRVNGLGGKLAAGSGTTLLVPSGNGALDLDDLPMVPPPAAEPEPVKVAASPAKGGKTARAGDTKVAAKGTGKAAASGKGAPVKQTARGGETKKVAAKSEAKPSGKTTAKAESKPSGKVAKAANGKRG